MLIGGKADWLADRHAHVPWAREDAIFLP
jgi:hypothetical protein